VVGHVLVALYELFRAVVIELVVGVQEFEEIVEVPFESDLDHDALHLAVNTLDLVETDLVNFLPAIDQWSSAAVRGRRTTLRRRATRPCRPFPAQRPGTRHR
jgi:hypothetical protein